MDSVNLSRAVNAYKNASNGIVEKLPGQSEIAQAAKTAGVDFSQLVGESLTKAIDTQYGSEVASVKSLANQTELTDLVTAVANAELTLNTVVAVRDKVISAYQDIVKMPI